MNGLEPRWAAVVLLALYPHPPFSAQELVERLQTRYEQIQSFSASFRQVFRGRGVELEESGTVLMKKPGRMYWEYRHPHPKFFVSDGRTAYFYVPRDRQVMISELDAQDGDAPLLFLLGRGDIRQDFHSAWEREESPLEPGNLLLRLTPRRPESEFAHLILEIDPESLLIRRLCVIEPIGNRNEYILTQLETNVNIPDRRFAFTIPRGVEVIR